MHCKCKGSCSRKDGPKRKGCPCKTAKQLCGPDCLCGSKTTSCQNKSATDRPSTARSSSTTVSANVSARPSEMEECERENEDVKKLVTGMDVGQLRGLAINVLCRGVGSIEFIESQLVAIDIEETNYYGSPLRHTSATPASTSAPFSYTRVSASTSAPASQAPAAEQEYNIMDSTPLTDQATNWPESNPSPPTPPPPFSTRVSLSNSAPASPAPVAQHEIPTNSTPLRETTNWPEPPPPPPPPVHPVPDWCRCGHCRHMPREVERLCCKNRKCVAGSSRFAKLCLDLDVLRISLLDRAETRNDRFDGASRQFRKSAYRHFILDKYGYLGRGNRRVVPSCCVWRVRDKYPSVGGVYMGFKES